MEDNQKQFCDSHKHLFALILNYSLAYSLLFCQILILILILVLLFFCSIVLLLLQHYVLHTQHELLHCIHNLHTYIAYIHTYIQVGSRGVPLELRVVILTVVQVACIYFIKKRERKSRCVLI